jgi:hypothetical protein
VVPDTSIQNELLTYLGQLPADDQVRVVDFARSLAQSPKPRQVGVPGSELLRFVDTIPPEDLEEMKRIIEEDCERIDLNEW